MRSTPTIPTCISKDSPKNKQTKKSKHFCFRFKNCCYISKFHNSYYVYFVYFVLYIYIYIHVHVWSFGGNMFMPPSSPDPLPTAPLLVCPTFISLIGSTGWTGCRSALTPVPAAISGSRRPGLPWGQRGSELDWM